MRLAHAWMEAVQRRDEATLARLIAPDFTYQATGMGRMTREEWLGAARSAYEIVTFAYDDILIRRYGDTAVMQSRYRQEATYQGTSRSGELLLTDVWVRRESEWQVVARQSSFIA